MELKAQRENPVATRYMENARRLREMYDRMKDSHDKEIRSLEDANNVLEGIILDMVERLEPKEKAENEGILLQSGLTEDEADTEAEAAADAPRFQA